MNQETDFSIIYSPKHSHELKDPLKLEQTLRYWQAEGQTPVVAEWLNDRLIIRPQGELK